MNWLRRHPRALVPALVLGFLVFRAALFAVTTAGEYRLYRDYGEAARSAPAAELYRTRDVEYPHLTVGFAALTAVVADALPGWAPHLVHWRPNKREPFYLGEPPAVQDAGDRYEVALGLVLFAVDVGCLVLVWLVARWVYPADDRLARVGRLAGYVVGTGALGLILYDRLDLVVGAVALLGLWALAAGRPALGYAILTAGTAYKLVPALLLPVWVLAAAAVRAAPAATPGRYLGWVVREAAVAGLILAAWPLLTYWLGGGDRGFVFLTYHSVRGLQLDAPAAWPLLLLDPPAEVGHSFGSYNLRGEPADALAKLARLAMPLAVLAATALAARGFWRLAATRQRPAFPDTVPHAVAASLLVWLAFILANKVGSPQFLLWVAPLVPLLPLRAWAERAWAALLLVAFLFTTAVFPCAYPLVVGPLVRDDPPTWGGPTAFCALLLAARSVTLTIATVWLAASVWREPRVPHSSLSPVRV